jgi:hypothetical protein
MTPARLDEIRRRLADQYPDGWIGVCVELLRYVDELRADREALATERKP